MGDQQLDLIDTTPAPLDAEAIMQNIVAESKRRELLVAVSYKLPVAVRNNLRRAARRHDVTQTDIILGALRPLLPILLAAPPKKL
jgi:hypothetical protein